MVSNIQDISINKIDGSILDWSEFKGKLILIVNVASECGYTPQYTMMQELYDQYKDRLEIIGVPCNDFGGQEPGGVEEIVSFCTKNYGVTFTLTEKINIASDPHPLYQWLTSKTGATVEWNFHKFLVDQEKERIASFSSGVSPLDDQILAYLD